MEVADLDEADRSELEVGEVRGYGAALGLARGVAGPVALALGIVKEVDGVDWAL